MPWVKNAEEAEAAEAALAAEESTEDAVEVADAELTAEDTETDEEDEEDKPAFDIYLRESARIMADWIQIEAADKPAVMTNNVADTAEAL